MEGQQERNWIFVLLLLHSLDAILYGALHWTFVFDYMYITSI